VILPNPFRFFAAMGRALWCWVRGERIIVPPDVAEMREDRCYGGCPHRVDDQCGICTCVIVAKVWFADEQCADKKNRRWRKWKYDPLQNRRG
jgi:hypothetical protein